MMIVGGVQFHHAGPKCSLAATLFISVSEKMYFSERVGLDFNMAAPMKSNEF